ncbi:VWA domain-containing protein [Sandaracinus amylolyticus]|uniref:VWA domain-containing protein n=1 Tax=Sandaracinus amylolyticus TaxID=927083 RepID=UPI001F20BD4F|nr:VWA domain-containing protein [Sandaracinus amylolyticus]UJR79605.1 VWFA domain-containing protein [Sandaracinus amylolyticus]
MSNRSALVITLLASILAACTTRGTPGREATFVECTNGIDDDQDGLLDCAEATCGAHCEDGPGGADAGLPRDAGPRADARITCNALLDVVFVIDVSTSMREEAERLRTGVESIWNAAHALTSNTQFGLVVFVDDAVAVNGCGAFTSIASLQSELMRWRDFCGTNRSPSSDLQNTDCAENSLDALHLAATTCPWRAGATRVIVHVTDDTFAERPQVLSESVAVEHTYAEVASELVSRELRVGAFAVPGVGEPCGAGSSPDVGRGFHAPFGSMPSLPMQTRGRAYDLRAVRSGTLDMAASITELLADEYCTLF